MRGVQVATRWTSAAKLLTTSVDVEDPDNIPAAYFDVPYVEMGFSGATKLSKNGKPVPVELAPSRTQRNTPPNPSRGYWEAAHDGTGTCL